MISENDLLKIVKYAAKAPSGHNTQPWKFKPGKSSVTILPDFDRALPVADTNHHELYISIGCALENLKIAAGVYGYKAEVNLQDMGEAISVAVHFTSDSETVKDNLFNYIERRQVRRNLYTSQTIPGNIIKSLKDVCREKSIGIDFFCTPEERELLSPFILEAARLQTENKAFMNELIHWIRFSEKEAVRCGDGIWMPAFSLPNTGRLFGTFLFKRLITAGSEVKRWKRVISHTPCFTIFSVEKDEPLNWIKLGQVFQRFALTATGFELSHAHMNMPCEVKTVRKKMTGQLSLQNNTPLLLIRLGYSKPMPYSFRRHLNEVVTR